MEHFLQDVLRGLLSTPKYLESKYFYNADGDALFRQIMDCPEYYPTKCEMEIFSCSSAMMAKTFCEALSRFDIVELGPGDATKSIHLLKELASRGVSYNYFPVDISANIISTLSKDLPRAIPGLNVLGLNGEYFAMLEKAKTLSEQTKVVLFLGSNIGNIPLEQAENFCRQLRWHLLPGDFILIGFDLKKDPRTILDAYNDKGGFTRQFNLNLLRRINDELQGNFDIKQFDHYPTYDPVSGACKSYLISNCRQNVHINGRSISFDKYEPIFMEISQKFTVDQTDLLAQRSGFVPVQHLFDSRGWFLDTVWRCV